MLILHNGWTAWWWCTQLYAQTDMRSHTRVYETRPAHFIPIVPNCSTQHVHWYAELQAMVVLLYIQSHRLVEESYSDIRKCSTYWNAWCLTGFFCKYPVSFPFVRSLLCLMPSSRIFFFKWSLQFLLVLCWLTSIAPIKYHLRGARERLVFAAAHCFQLNILTKR